MRRIQIFLIWHFSFIDGLQGRGFINGYYREVAVRLVYLVKKKNQFLVCGIRA